MTRALGPLSISIWDEPGLLIEGFDNPPTIMLGHNSPLYRAWIEDAGYRPVTRLINYGVPITDGFPLIVERIVAAGGKNERLRIRCVDKHHSDSEVQRIKGQYTHD